MYNHIKKMLRIPEPALEITGISEEKVKDRHSLLIHGILSPKIKACESCGSSAIDQNGKRIVVKNGKKISDVILNSYNHMPTVMRLSKQRFRCKNCQSYWTAQTYFIGKGCFITKQVKLKILDLLREKISMTFIAHICDVSITTVIRVLREVKPIIPKRKHGYLPSVLMVDEFRSHASYEDKMSFICADGESGELVDILPTRKLPFLIKYFKEFRNPKQVNFLVTDMNAAYFQLPNYVFPNAKVVIDRFHIVKHCNQAFNDLRIRIMKAMGKNTEGYRKLKANWKFLIKNKSSVDHYEYKTWKSFRTPKYPFMTEAMMINRLLAYSAPLKAAYHYFHDLMNAFREKNHKRFFELLKNVPKNLDETFRKKLENLLTFEDGIRNAMIYDYSNGKIEAKNTHIKTLKRVSYGFQSFENMRIRIFLMNGLIKPR